MRAIWFCVVTLLLLLPSPCRTEVWTEESTTKVLKDAVAPATTPEVILDAAGNEWTAFQVVIAAGEGPIGGVSVEITALTGPLDAVISADNAELFLEYYVQIETPSPCEPLLGLPNCGGHDVYIRSPGYYPDALVPFLDPYAQEETPVAVPFDVPGNDLQTVFVDLHVPADSPAGDYSGEVLVTSNGESLASIPLSLHVWDFNIPVKRNIATSYGLIFNYISKYHGGPDGPDDEAEEYFIRNYELEFHKHRIDLEKYRDPLRVELDEEGNLAPIDFAEYDAFFAPRIDGSYYPDGAGINRFDLGKFGPGKGTKEFSEDQYSEAARIVAEHLEDKGWLKHVYLYSLDEPWQLEKWRDGSYAKINADVELLNKKTGLWKGHVMVTGPFAKSVDEAVDIWCPDTFMYDEGNYGPGTWPGPEKYEELLADGKELWFYVCRMNVPPFLGYDIDTKLGYEPRLLKWQAWYEKGTGFLFWTTNYWNNSDPWNIVVKNPKVFVEEFDRHGNGILIYPGNHDGKKAPTGSPEWVSMDGPVFSLRMKQIRDGLEDWEMFILASSLGAEEYTRQQVARVHRKFGELIDEDFDIDDPPWTLDEHELLDARRQVARKIQYLLHPDLYEDPEASPVLLEEPAIEPMAEAADLTELSPDALAPPESVSDCTDSESEPQPTPAGKASGCHAGDNPGPLSLVILLAALAGLAAPLGRIPAERNPRPKRTYPR